MAQVAPHEGEITDGYWWCVSPHQPGYQVVKVHTMPDGRQVVWQHDIEGDAPLEAFRVSHPFLLPCPPPYGVDGFEP